MSQVIALAKKELRQLFSSPMAWTFLAVLQFIGTWLMLVQTDLYLSQIQPKLAALTNPPGVTDLIVASTVKQIIWPIMIIWPLIAMRVFADEKRLQTLPLLISAPISLRNIVLGKFLGLVAFTTLALALLAATFATLELGTQLDWGRFWLIFLTTWLFAVMICAIGLYCSSLTTQPVVAAVMTYGIVLFFWLIDVAGNIPGESANTLSALSSSFHFNDSMRGILDSGHMLYFVIITVACLALSIKHLDDVRADKQ